MKKQAHCRIRTPKALANAFMSSDFYIGRCSNDVKIASWWVDAPLREKYHLLKTAEARDCEDLSEVYEEALATMPSDAEEEE